MIWRRSAWVLLGLAAWLLLAAPALPAAAPADDAVTHIELDDRIEFLIDPSGRWAPGMPEPAPGFRPLRERWSGSNFGTRDARLWLRTTIDATPATAGDWWWVVANPHLEHLDLRVSVDGREVSRWQGGNAAPDRAQTVRLHPLLLAPVTLQAGARHTVYMRVETRGIAYVPVSLWRPQAFWHSDQRRYLAWGLYFGLAAGLFAYNLFLCLMIRERVYAHYLGCVLGLALSQLANTGLGAQWWWPAAAGASTLVHNLALAGAAALAIPFLRAFLGTATALPRVDRWLRATTWAWLAVLAGLPLVDNVTAGHLMAPLGLVTMAFLIVISIQAAWRRRPGARYFALAWVILLFTGALFALIRLGWLPYHPVLANVMMVGSSLEMVLLSFALADRIRAERRAKERAVAERTAESVRRDEAQRALAEKSRFMAALTHDLQQPLYAMRLAMQSIEQVPATPPLAASLLHIRSAMQTADELLASLTMVVRLDRADLQPDLQVHPVQDMLDRIEFMFEPLARERGLDWRVTPSLACVRSDPALLQRMVCNLVANAFRYTERGGVLLSCRQRREGLLLQIWDTGPGIAPEERSLIFEEYARGGAAAAAPAGLGLGLAIVRRCADLMGIRMSLRSRLGRGTCFALLVPTPGTDG